MLAMSGAEWFVAIWLAVIGGAILVFGLLRLKEWMSSTPEERQAHRERGKTEREQQEAERAEGRRREAEYRQAHPATTRLYVGAPTRQDLEKPVVVKTLPRMTASVVRQRLIENMASEGYALTNMTRTTTGKTILTFTRG